MDEEQIANVILSGDEPAFARMLSEQQGLATARFMAPRMVEDIAHWIYATDTVLHFVAAAHQVQMTQGLLRTEAMVDAVNRRGATPLHYAADGYPQIDRWDPSAQVQTIECLLSARADVDRADNNGATALHRAVRTRCADAVDALIAAGANTKVRNKSGSTPFHLAVQNTGRGGTGSDRSRDLQFRIIEIFKKNGVSVELKDGKGRTVLESCRSDEVRALLA